MNDEELKLSDFQKRVLVTPETVDVFLGGGRGGAKSFTFALLALRHIEQYGARARILYIRQTYRGLADFEQITRDIFGAVYGKEARFNASEHVWRFPNGAYMELGQLEGPNDYSKYQGRSFTLLFVDEAGQFPDPALLDRLRSNLRGSKDMPIRMVKAANPGDPGHHWLASRYVFKAAAAWEPFHEPKSNRMWIHAPSTFLDNPFIDQEEYRKQLEASCPADPELLRAWLEGDWAVNRGAYFAHVLGEEKNAVNPWPHLPKDPWQEWDIFLAHDYGASAPSVTYVCAESPGAKGPDGVFYPKDSLVLVDELATNEPGSLTKGMGYTVPVLAEAIKELVEAWEMKRASGVADDAIFSVHGAQAGSISDEFKRAGVFFRPAKKADRKTGWEVMRRLLQDAGKPDVPGLYISRSCEYFWSTVPFLARDPKRQDDVDTRGPDHGADCCRYAVTRSDNKLRSKKIKWI